MASGNANPSTVWDTGAWAKVDSPSFDFMTSYIMEHIVSRSYLKGKHLLELGAGSGRLGYLMLEEGASHVTLVDSSHRACELSRGLFRGKDPKNYSIVENDIFSFSPDKKYDLVFSSGLVEHFRGEERRQIILTHLEHTQNEAIIIHPTGTLYAALFNNFPFAIKRYGYQKAFSQKELDLYLRASRTAESWTHERFHPFYTVPFLHNRGPLNRLFDKALKGQCGGLTMTHIKVRR